VVPILDRHELADLFETLSEIEALSSGFASKRMRDIERRELVDCAKRCLDCEDGNTYAILNEEFHRRIDEGSRNRALQEVLKLVRTRAASYRRYQFMDLGRIRESSRQHVEIADAVNDSDSVRATALMHDHIISAGTTVMSLLKS
jgi:DNA-binding GntR family transcriptional regulator